MWICAPEDEDAVERGEEGHWTRVIVVWWGFAELSGVDFRSGCVSDEGKGVLVCMDRMSANERLGCWVWYIEAGQLTLYTNTDECCFSRLWTGLNGISML